jgi:radical SAM protein with 4Fe4S-binding SPASM domain
MQVKKVVFSGGEPMVRADLPAILEHARAKGLHITLLTSGILIDPDWAKFLAGLNIRVKVSLDGVTSVTHDFLRGNGAYQMLLKALACLRSAGMEDLAVHFTVHRHNLGELLKLPEFLPTVGVKNLMVGMIKPSGRAKVNSELLIPPEMVPYVRQKIEILGRSGAITLQQFSDRGWEGFGCPATCNKFGVTASGNTTTCAFFGTAFLGNSIREFSLSDLWEQHLTQGDMFSANEQCVQCPTLPVSGGGCRARALYYHHDINGTDPYCCALHQKTVFLEKHLAVLENEMNQMSPCSEDIIR